MYTSTAISFIICIQGFLTIISAADPGVDRGLIFEWDQTQWDPTSATFSETTTGSTSTAETTSVASNQADSTTPEGGIVPDTTPPDLTPSVSAPSIDVEDFDAHEYAGLDLDQRVDATSKKITPKAAANYLQKFGYENADLKGMNGKRLEKLLRPSILRFQKRMEIDQTGELDDKTKHEMAVPRCDFPDYITPTSSRSKRYIIGGNSWSSGDFPLSVGFSGHSRKMGNSEQEKAFMAAADSWAKVSGLAFKKGPSRGSSITIDFTHHDGPWGILGKAWFPRVGKIEFENGENWEAKIPTRGGTPGRLSFYSVAMHELGHALGISHSNVKNAIMHGQYQRDILNLQNDDIKAATKLYGPPRGGGSSRSNRGDGGNNRSKTKPKNNNNRGNNNNNKRNNNNKGNNKGNNRGNNNNRGKNNNNRNNKGSNNNKKNINNNNRNNRNKNGSRNNNRGNTKKNKRGRKG